jgi:hypothetical protein
MRGRQTDHCFQQGHIRRIAVAQQLPKFLIRPGGRNASRDPDTAGRKKLFHGLQLGVGGHDAGAVGFQIDVVDGQMVFKQLHSPQRLRVPGQALDIMDSKVDRYLEIGIHGHFPSWPTTWPPWAKFFNSLSGL